MGKAAFWQAGIQLGASEPMAFQGCAGRRWMRPPSTCPSMALCPSPLGYSCWSRVESSSHSSELRSCSSSHQAHFLTLGQ